MSKLDAENELGKKNNWMSKEEYIAKLKAEGKYNPKEYFAGKEKKDNIVQQNEEYHNKEKIKKLTEWNRDLEAENLELDSKVKSLTNKLEAIKNKDVNKELESVRNLYFESRIKTDSLQKELDSLRNSNSNNERKLTKIKEVIKYLQQGIGVNILVKIAEDYKCVLRSAAVYEGCTDGSYECERTMGLSKIQETYEKEVPEDLISLMCSNVSELFLD